MIVPGACDPFGFWVTREVGTTGDKGTQGVILRESEQGGKKHKTVWTMTYQNKTGFYFLCHVPDYALPWPSYFFPWLPFFV